MALFEFYCSKCDFKFEQIAKPQDSSYGVCTQCGLSETKLLISKFAVGGRGDLRESTYHGCHDSDFHSADENHKQIHNHGKSEED